MPDALPLTGLYGKVPAHGDFVRRGLPTSFIGPWDAWLQAAIARARDSMGAHWQAAWDAAPAWRFALPAGACGPDAVAGVMLPSEDQVGRRFPITLAVLLAPGAGTPAPAWYDLAEALAWAGRTGRMDAAAMASALPLPGAPLPEVGRFGLAPAVAAVPFTDVRPGAAPPRDATDDVLALLAGGAGEAPPESEAPPSDVLALPGAAVEDREPPGLSGVIGAPDADGTLAMLIGAGEGDAMPQPPEGDPLAALIGAAAESGAAPAADVLPAATVAQPWPEAASPRMEPEHEEPSPVMPPAEAPPPPDGGGWWTRGGARVPPMVWPLPALPPAEDFAYLLEAEA